MVRIIPLFLPASACQYQGQDGYTEQEKEVVGKLFPTCEKISIDYAVMEKSKEIYTLPADESKVVVQGLDGYIVAEKNGQLVVCSLKEEQRIKEYGKCNYLCL